jgi:hypothetical protein
MFGAGYISENVYGTVTKSYPDPNFMEVGKDQPKEYETYIGYDGFVAILDQFASFAGYN